MSIYGVFFVLNTIFVIIFQFCLLNYW